MKFFIFSLCVFLSACSTIDNQTPAEDSKPNSISIKNETLFYASVLSHLLSLNNDRYQYIDSEGHKRVDELKSFKELESIYDQALRPNLANNRYSSNQLKVIMVFAFYAEERNSAAFNEYLATDLMPIYLSDPKEFLTALKDVPFLIPSNCSRLNAFFSSEAVTGNKSDFLATNNDIIIDILADRSSECLSAFNK